MSSAAQPAAGSALKVLCFDGGGVRGLSSLLILEEIMERIQESKRLSQVPKPCDRFDFIGGMGMGGIIAIMLGRLRMSVHEAIQAYKHLADTVFVPKPTPTTTSSSAFSAAKLEMAIKEMIRNNCCDPQCARLRESDGPVSDTSICPHEDLLFLDEHCTKTVVLAMTKLNLETSPTLLKTYSCSECFRECKVWEVARATSAAATVFDPIKLGHDQIEFIHPSSRYNNACEQLIAEAQNQFPDKQMLVLIIGTGLSDVAEAPDSKSSVLEALSKKVTTSTHTNFRLKDGQSGTAVYHRFNVENGLRDTEISDRDKWSRIAAHTINYLREKMKLVNNFVTAFTTSGILQPQICHDEKDKQCLSDFCVTDPLAEKKSIEIKKGGLLKDCYQWIVDHEDFQRFLKEEESGILWIKGDPGKGKTMLLCGIIDTLALDYSVDVSYFFCQATSRQLNTATSVLRTLIFDLACRNPQLTKHLRAKYDFMGKAFFSNDSLWHSLCDILTALLDDPSLQNPILIVDALDECSVGLQDLLEFITERSRAKWIVSSRNWRDIEEFLDDAEQQVKIHLETNQDCVSAAVDSYITLKVDQLTKEKNWDYKLKHDILEHLQSNANGTFLWVALVVQELSHGWARKRRVPYQLKSFPPGLYPLYERMLEHMSKLKHAHVYKEIIATALVVYRPITLEEMGGLVGAFGGLNRYYKKKVIALCGSFLIVHDDVVSFVHQSAKDYLLKQGSHMIAPSLQHERVFLRSLGILHRKLKRDIYGLQTPGCLIDEVSVPEPDPLAAIQYSCTFWVDHLCDSAETGIASKSDKVLAFIKDKYLQWLEVLSLLKNISAAGRGMARLRLYFGESSNNLNDIIMDARRFLLFHGEVIEIAPLQVYASALIFSPTGSLIRKMFHHEEPDWIALKPRVEANWAACLRTLVGHDDQVTSVVFSNDEHRLASGSWDGTVKIWDATSGTCLLTLEGHHGPVTSVVFESSERRLASGSYDKTVKIWDAVSGVCLWTFAGHDSEVTSVVFESSERQLASGSYDKTVKIWDATSGVCLHTLGGHDSGVTSVVFSCLGERLASGSYDKTVKIWDAISGVCLWTLEGHDSRVTSVVFRSFEQRLASGSYDKTVKIWDATSGACLHTLEGHDSGVTSAVFSYDGQRLASGSYDKTVKIWDATSGACLHTLEGHDSGVISAVFSYDGERLASGSNDKTVKIWDSAPGALSHGVIDDIGFPKSPSSKYRTPLSSWLTNETVKTPNASSSASQNLFEGHGDRVTSAVFSKDGERLASGSYDRTIKIWDATSGICLHTLEGHDQAVTSIVFSNDGQRLASGSSDRTVKIWDATSGKCLQTLEWHDDEAVTPAVFSNNGQRLASGPWDMKGMIWNVISGLFLQTLPTSKTAPCPSLDVGLLETGLNVTPETPPIRQTSVITPTLYSYTLSTDGTWIMKDGQRILYLPLNYRPRIPLVVAGQKVVIVDSSWRVMIITFT